MWREQQWFRQASPGFQALPVRISAIPTTTRYRYPDEAATIGSLPRALKRLTFGIIPARPDALWREAQFSSDDSLQCRPRPLESLARRCRVVAIRDREPGKGAAALLQRGKYIGRVPIGGI